MLLNYPNTQLATDLEPVWLPLLFSVFLVIFPKTLFSPWVLLSLSTARMMMKPNGFFSVTAKLRYNAWVNNCMGSLSTRAVSYIRTLANFQLEGIQSLRQSFHSSSDEDDDFSELGLPVAQGVGTLRKLKTEKPEPYKVGGGDMERWEGISRLWLHKKSQSTSRSSLNKSFNLRFKQKKEPKSNGVSLPAGGKPNLKDIHSKVSNSSPALRLKLENHDNDNTSTLDPTFASNFNSSTSIAIEDVPSTINISQLEEEISIFGMISKASMSRKPNELGCCYVEFKSVKACKRAITVGWISVKDFNMSIRPLHVQETVTIRISNISSETTDSAIHSMCMSYGPLVGLVRTKEGGVDALFAVEDNSETQSILKKLNHTIMDTCKWTANLHPRDSTSSVVMTEGYDTRSNMRTQIRSHLAEVKSQMSMKKVYMEDLGVSATCLMRLEHHPATRIVVLSID